MNAAAVLFVAGIALMLLAALGVSAMRAHGLSPAGPAGRVIRTAVLAAFSLLLASRLLARDWAAAVLIAAVTGYVLLAWWRGSRRGVKS